MAVDNIDPRKSTSDNVSQLGNGLFAIQKQDEVNTKRKTKQKKMLSAKMQNRKEVGQVFHL